MSYVSDASEMHPERVLGLRCLVGSTIQQDLGTVVRPAARITAIGVEVSIRLAVEGARVLKTPSNITEEFC